MGRPLLLRCTALTLLYSACDPWPWGTPHEAARVHHAARRRGSCLAARGARAAGDHTCGSDFSMRGRCVFNLESLCPYSHGSAQVSRFGLPRGTWGEKIGRPKEKGGPRLGKCRQRLGTVMSGGSMTANHIEHGIATFPRITITVALHVRRGTECNVPGWS